MTTGSSSVDANRLQRRLLLGILALGVGSTPFALAHRTDEYLHAAFVGIRPAGVELQLSLTPGASVAPAVLAEIDADRDGRLSDSERRAYAESILAQLRLDLDDAPIKPQLESYRFPETAALRDGMGIVELKATIHTASFAAGPHRLLLINQHTNHATVYLANALQPETGEIEIVRQTRDLTQSELRIHFAVHPAFPPPALSPSKGKHPWLPLAVFVTLLIALFPVLQARSKRTEPELHRPGSTAS